VQQNPYDRVAYRTFPRRQTHPDRLAAVGTLFGMRPAPVTQSRVLEIGCGSGGNLIPQAYTLRGSKFLGIDLAKQPIAAASKTARALELDNLELRVCDLRDLSPSDGAFDYVIAHGIYSWIPAEVRDALLGVCRALLAPQGIAYVSYNAYPGQYERRMLREMLLYRGDDVASAREFLRTLPHSEAAALADSPDDILFHDILAPCFHPAWFHEFAAHARDHGLRYLGEADVHDMFDDSGRLVDEGGEQELDFRRLRRFRQTLLCREEVRLTRSIREKQMDGFLFSKCPHGRRIPGDDPTVEAVAQALDDVHPLPVRFEELLPYAGSRNALREILRALLAGGCADIHIHDFPCEESVTEFPRASRLARYQAASSLVVTNLCHVPVQLDEVARQLLLILDGRRNQDTLARRLAALPGAGPAKSIRQALPRSLEWMARMALLET
jgi:SAM-dependent methyltransferase